LHARPPVVAQTKRDRGAGEIKVGRVVIRRGKLVNLDRPLGDGAENGGVSHSLQILRRHDELQFHLAGVGRGRVRRVGHAGDRSRMEV